MAKKMLIDAGHPEETRVVILAGNRVEEFDFEAASKKQLKGNIYLAKVTRVEPSLQAAFVEYGGNRHGFLAFGEIHPDYYQIPVADRQALLEEEAAAERAADLEEDEEAEDGEPAHDRHEDAAEDQGEDHNENEGSSDDADGDGLAASLEAAPAPQFESTFEDAEAERISEASSVGDGEHSDDEAPSLPASGEIVDVASPRSAPEEVGATDAMEEVSRKRRRMMRKYKIQEVIKRRQIILIQVVKEERGNKGAALTTYLSLAGRYCVLMPNTDRGGGISRKITQANDRKRLKDIANELEVPNGMGLIIRTAGANRTKAELKRDYEYLLRLWESVRELTLQSVAPKLVYEEGNLVKRSIRDLYGRDIDTVQVEGDEAYREAKAFMRMLTPSHAKNVQQYKDRVPLFQRYQIESQLDALYSPTVELRSGGYIVINPTEALVSIDVNSGRATKEHSIEDTALKTNLEAAEEIARQLRLRDLAGLIVIDFIDMEENRNDRQVERKLKDCLKNDRARIQVGRISAFGLLEMSRQRLRSSVLEGQTLVCAHCEGSGRVPSIETTVLRILRAVEEEGIRGRMNGVQVRATGEVALYLLNHKRWILQDIEARYNMPCFIDADAELIAGQYKIERAPEALVAMRAAATRPPPILDALTAGVANPDAPDLIDETEDFSDDENVEEAAEAQGEAASESEAQSDEEEDGRGRRRRRRRRPGDRPETERPAAAAKADVDTESAEEETDDADEDAETRDARANGEDAESAARRKRRRGRRGGRRNRRPPQDGAADHSDATQISAADAGQIVAAHGNDGEAPATPVASEAETFREIEILAPAGEAGGGAETAPAPSVPEPALAEANEFAGEPEPQAAPTRANEHIHVNGNGASPGAVTDRVTEPANGEPPKKGWWQRRIFG